MNKFLKTMLCAGLCGSMVFAAACGGGGTDNPSGNGGQKYNPETRPLYLSIGAVDGTFNPFFYTSLTDGNVVSMTQASLITTEVTKSPNGQNEVNPVAGEQYPTIAKDFSVNYFAPYSDTPTSNSSLAAVEGGRTEYDFLIKKGMKYSDGTEITIKDVLFNFYVYLDPSYAGSNTMYSVNIQGLKAYTENDANQSDDGDDNSILDEQVASQRIEAIINYSNGEIPINDDIQEDIQKVLNYFKEELETDWTANKSGWSTNYKTNYTFTQAWQAYLFMEGAISVQRYQDGSGASYAIRLDENKNFLNPSSEEYKMGKNLTTLDPWYKDANVTATNYEESNGVAVTAAYNGIIGPIEAATANLVDANGNVLAGKQDEYDEVTKNWCIDYLYKTYSDRTNLKYIADRAYSDFVKEAHAERTANSKNPRYYISGLQTYTTDTFKGKALGGTYDVFKIVVNNVDPAAIWQFGVSIAPLHYYSGTWNGKNYVTSFNGDQNGGKGPGDATTCFGLERDNLTFLNSVIKSTTKNGIPVGAGAYMTADEDGNATRDRSKFENANQINYVRNPYFETMGEQIENAKIKNLRYKVLDEDKIIPSLLNNELDYGEPNATPTNYNTVTNETNKSMLGVSTYRTNGYGYVGVNAAKIPDVEVRRAIMGVMDTSEALRYYGSGLATNIYRSLSAVSWAYPNVDDLDRNIIPELASAEAVKNYLIDSGKVELKGNSLYSKTTGEQLKYTFTIAGANSDHPAYTMFNNAARILNAAGFDISVSTDPNALMKLTNGGLEVWAAAWSSGVDPDMYQVWHKDSNATSVLNWGYDKIKNDTQKYSYEWGIIQTLSEKIEAGRATDSKGDRIDIYAECLDLVMELSVELPIYQRNDLCVYNKNVIDPASLNPSPNCYNSLINNIWEVNYL